MTHLPSMLKPTPLDVIVLLLILAFQVIFASSHVTIHGEIIESENRFGIGAPVAVVTENGHATYQIKWFILIANFMMSFALATVISSALTKATGLKHPAKAFGLVAGITLIIVFLASTAISKAYWGYFILRPPLFAETRDLVEVRNIISFTTDSGSEKHEFVPETKASLSADLASAKRYKDDALSTRILPVLEEMGLLPKSYGVTLDGFPNLYSLITSSGLLVGSEEGYNSSSTFHGVLVDAIDTTGQAVLLLCVSGGQVSNDHYPYYEMLFHKAAATSGYVFKRGQQFYYDAAGIEGFEWYLIFILLSATAVGFSFVVFTLVRTALPFWRERYAETVATPSGAGGESSS